MEITDEQLNQMCHALGFNELKKFNITKSYRNYFCVDPDYKIWADLVEKGLATRGKIINDGKDQYFHVTEKGIELLNQKKGENK